jgi:hypothetical protein
VAIQLVLDFPNDHSPSDRAAYDHRRDVVLLLFGNFDVGLHKHYRLVALESVVVEFRTFDVHSVDSVEIFFVELAVDAEIEELKHNPAEESCCSSCFVGTNMQIAFA